MKNLLLSFCMFLILSNMVIAQNKTTYMGIVESSQMISINHKQTLEQEKSTVIEFSVRTIKVGEEIYNIVSKRFDGNKTSTFLCNKGRGNYLISYVADEYISIQDQRTPGIETRYAGLLEK